MKKILYLLCMSAKYLLIGILLTASLNSLLLASEGNAQIKSIHEVYLDLNLENEKLVDALKTIEKRTNFNFVFTKNDLPRDLRVSINAREQTIGNILMEFSRQARVSFQQVNQNISVRKINELSGDENIEKIEVIIQSRTVTGRVTSMEDNEGLPGVNVVEKGTSNGTVTDVEGNYSLEVAENATLVFSSVGFTTEEVIVGNRSSVDLAMAQDIQQLQELVVVGYGEQKEENLTGSVETISGENISKRPVGQTSMALQGAVPGLTVTQSTGQPGRDGGALRIRGIGTLSNSEPLIIVDGVESNTNINDIDPNDIKSISVLKDAASASIYGARAANGVVLITTKRGNSEKLSINYKNFFGIQTPTQLPEPVGALDHMNLLNEANRNEGQTETFSESFINDWRSNQPSDEYPNTDWGNLMIDDKSFQQSHYMSISGGSDNFNTFGSLSYLNQDGITPGTGFERYGIRINNDYKPVENINIGFDVNYFDKTIDDDIAQIFRWFNRLNPLDNAINSNGTFGVGFNNNNPVAESREGGYIQNKERILNLSLHASWEPIKGLVGEVYFAPNITSNRHTAYNRVVDLFLPDGTLNNPTEYRARLSERYEESRNNNIRGQITYSLGTEKHFLKILAGYSQINFQSENLRAYRDQFPLAGYDVLNAGAPDNQQANGSFTEWGLKSYYGRINYDLNSKYLFEANLRYDGSSRFTGDNQYGLFPSLSAGWRISEEPFLVSSNLVKNLKLRGSWGKLGNQNIGSDFPFASTISLSGETYVFNNNVPALGGALLDAANPDISWESTEMLNIGLDLNLWGNLDLTAEYYVRNTEDILLQLPIPLITGLNAPFRNAGTVVNRGWDLIASYKNNFNDFNYNLSLVLSDVNNEINSLFETGPYIYDRTIDREGDPINSLFGYEAVGLFQSQNEVDEAPSQFGNVGPGDIKYKDQNSDGVINDQDRVVIGNQIPKKTYSLNIAAEYKGFDFSAFIQGVGDVDGYIDEQGAWAFYVGSNAKEWHKDRWTPDNPNAGYPRLTTTSANNRQNSSYWVRSASYLRLKNVVLGYSLPSNIIEKSFLSSVRIYFSGENIITIDDFYPGFDPESPVGNGSFYPMVSTFVFGLDVKF